MPILGIWASQISGHLWAPAGAYDALATVTLSASASSITFSGIPQGYKHLQIRMIARESNSATGQGAVWMQFNGDTGSNYAWHRLYGNGSGTPPTGVASSTTWMLAGINANNGEGANVFGASVIDILDYQNTSKNKTIRGLSGEDNNGSGYVGLHSGLWMNTSAVSSISIYPTATYSWLANSQFALYGVK